ncbi:alcohol oxidase-like protein [Dendrothele bispora CBS 962.96]|uniref:Alcohol oxidase-like protein n=1 Tax=Dendrothele bispora (strain CBS 962.96) TaxID=1314807 RepID=A0A4S8ML39_DENBC|nr:alcohol oxidase-like protein [Dendrothele bispora CBS 962.96]
MEYDIIFAGGGTSACLTAGRLATANPDLKILMLEAGEHTRNLISHLQPARYFSHLAPTSTTVSFHVAKPNPNVDGRSIVTPSGRCVGGGSSVNFTVYTRAAASDYDDWATKFNNPGWRFEDLLPLFKKTETYQISPGEPTHGYSGPLKVSYGGAYTNVGKQFLDVAEGYDRQYQHPVVRDFNDFNSGNAWIDQKSGRRSDVAHAFIYDHEHKNVNLKVLANSRVKRVIFENDRAVGVEYVADSDDGLLHVARASKCVVISAGTFGSPQILERSGIGNYKILEKLGISPKVDLPGVGENYQDHTSIFIPFRASDDADTLDGIFHGDPGDEEKYGALWKEEGKGLLAANAIDSGAKLRPNAQELEELGPAFGERWKTFFENSPDKPVLCLECGAASISDTPAGKYFTIVAFVEYPISTGSVHISHPEDTKAPAEFEAGFLSDASDLAILKWGYKKSREIARRMKVYRGEYMPLHPKFSTNESGSSDAAPRLDAPVGSVELDSEDIKYSKEDDEEIEKFTRRFAETSWHSLGTCAMKPRDQGGVVDPRLNVYGVKGLKVADLSIAPQNVSANTYSTALVIAEKAAVLITEDLGLIMK